MIISAQYAGLSLLECQIITFPVSQPKWRKAYTLVQ